MIIQIPLSRLKYFKALGTTAEPNARVEAMAADIKVHGIREPLIVRPVGDLFEVVCGLVRWKGAVVGGLETVPAEVRQLNDAEALELSMVDNMRPVGELEFLQAELADQPMPIVDVVSHTSTAPYKIDEPLGTGFCRLLESDFSLEEVQLLMKDSSVDSRNLEADLAMFWEGLAIGRLHVEGCGHDCGQFILAYIEAYFDVENPDVAFKGPNIEIWQNLTDGEREQVVADAIRLNPLVNAAVSVIYDFREKDVNL
ncbi:MAG: ParB/RepB/Spo0J family partition protein (plasmid) [Pseudomonas rhizophila]|uniref:ParB/RepB/Spo0J family partition protein n=1 Tax=Pseudomonas rhizophila TaxID=2045200 RepID=UPI003F6BD36F